MTIESDKWQDTDMFDDLPEYPKLGNAIRSWRLCDELTQESLAMQLSMSKQLLSRYERGEQLPSLQKTMEMANTLGAPLAIWIQHRVNDEIHQLGVDFTVTLQQQDAS